MDIYLKLQNIFEEFKKSGFKSNHELVTDSMLKSLAICGTSDQCRRTTK